EYMPQERDHKRVRPSPAMQVRLQAVKRLEPLLEKFSDDDLRQKTQELKERLSAGQPTIKRP
ncbi:MAG TPA: hypothetical protein VFP33_04795, partial [Gallionella sp.]|nr:hypothetical protein [Gallionella sp.]